MIEQLIWLVVLALPVACVAWTVTHEEIFREPREWMIEKSENSPHGWQRKFFYAFTCEYCFSHYVAAGAVALTGYRLLLDDWRGFLVGWLTLVAVANVYLSAYGRLRVEIRKEKTEIKRVEARTGHAG